ncbi:hypothetical protein CTRI78_v004444 [Colletotrichum trifolii]|uniref:Uncharacterized protein n=1 Tax=Colletotrichum trifolii TaxID=5466 RepID=A0A4R8RKH6_COLTR|nr:hypothetical protein CTRI78_v004444 [Colletotrichum trifolii]
MMGMLVPAAGQLTLDTLASPNLNVSVAVGRQRVVATRNRNARPPVSRPRQQASRANPGSADQVVGMDAPSTIGTRSPLRAAPCNSTYAMWNTAASIYLDSVYVLSPPQSNMSPTSWVLDSFTAAQPPRRRESVPRMVSRGPVLSLPWPRRPCLSSFHRQTKSVFGLVWLVSSVRSLAVLPSSLARRPKIVCRRIRKHSRGERAFVRTPVANCPEPRGSERGIDTSQGIFDPPDVAV